jgi:lipopolysaccharide export LptBFGC system permease protein LptF
MDLLDNLKDFQDAGTSIGAILGFYVNLIPYIFVSVAPAVLLLSCLYGLNRMSRANEIVSMLTAGRSLGQILRPILIVTAYASVLAMAANYHWAPRGEGRRQAVMNALTDKRQGSTANSTVMYRNEETRRTWYVGSVPFDLNQEKILRIEVREMDEKGHLVHGWYGASARWRNGTWSFYRGIQVIYDKGVAKEIIPFGTAAAGRIDITGWPETPWSIVSASLLPDNLSVSDLVSYLSANEATPVEKRAPFHTHLFQRFALPWECFVVVFMAAPLGVAFSRRGALGGIAGSVFIFFGLLFMNNLFLNMGKAAHMSPILAVWMPHLILGSLGALFMYLKSQNKELPKLSLKPLLRRLKA